MTGRSVRPATRKLVCHIRPIIQGVIANMGIDNLTILRRGLRDAYPFPGGANGSYRYQLWARECRHAIDYAWWAKRHPEAAEFRQGLLEQIERTLFYGSTEPCPKPSSPAPAFPSAS